MVDPDDTHLVGCIIARDDNEEEMDALNEWLQKAAKLEYEDGIEYMLINEYDDENLWWRGCNGMCFC